MITNSAKLISFIILNLIFFITTLKTNAQVTNTESFENTTFLPTGWTSVGSTTLWSRRTSGTFPTCVPQNGIGMVRFSSRAQTAGTNQTIASPVIDYSSRGSSTAYMSLWIYRDNGVSVSDSISLYINTSASLSGAVNFGVVTRYSKNAIPDTVATNGWYKYTFNVPSKYTGASNYILIKGISQNGYNIFIDEVQWNAFPNVCTGTPKPGTAVSSPAIICGGSGSATINLSGASTGVTGLTYQWKTASSASGPWTKVGNATATHFTGVITATQYYQCVVSCMNSGLSDSTPVMSVVVKQTANPVITVTPVNANYCLGTSGVKIYASGGSTYSWTPSAGLSSANTDTVYAAPTINTTYTVRGTDTAGCSAQAISNVSIRQAPVVSINAVDTVLCQGDSLLLTAQSGGGGNTYAWGPSGKSGTTIFTKPAADTKVILTATNTFGCKGTAFKNLYVKLKPIASFGTNITGRTYVFSDSSVNAKNVAWDFGDGNSSTNRNPVYTYSFDGTKTVRMIAFNPPCASDTFTQTFNVASINKAHQTGSFELYPNPAGDLINILFNHSIDPHSIIKVMDITGRCINTSTTFSNDGKSILFNTSALSAGHFYFEIGSAGENYKGHFVIIR